MPSIQILEFPANTLNNSIQVGDNVYFTDHNLTSPRPGFTKTITPNFLCVVQEIEINTRQNIAKIHVLDNETVPGTVAFVSTAYISFSKSSKVNHNDLIGYYNEVKFVNNSKQKAELFSVGTEATENSK